MKKLFITLMVAFASQCHPAMAQQTVHPTLSILGDSYSTFINHIPEGNASWYFDKAEEGRTDVSDVTQTWWWQLIKDGGYKLGKNDSFSGATICYTGYNGEDYKSRSFITRLPRLGSPDVILIFGGTNDSWAGSPIGEFTSGKPTEQELYSFRPAMQQLIGEAQKRYPTADIYFIINSELKPEITESAISVCNDYHVPYVLLHDIDKMSGHPSVAGMQQIKQQVMDKIASHSAAK